MKNLLHRTDSAIVLHESIRFNKELDCLSLSTPCISVYTYIDRNSLSPKYLVIPLWTRTLYFYHLHFFVESHSLVFKNIISGQKDARVRGNNGRSQLNDTYSFVPRRSRDICHPWFRLFEREFQNMHKSSGIIYTRNTALLWQWRMPREIWSPCWLHLSVLFMN